METDGARRLALKIPTHATRLSARPRSVSGSQELAEGGTAPYLSVELESGRLVVLERTAVRRRQESILKTYPVPAGRSVELNRKGQ